MNLSAIKAATEAGKYCTVLNADDGTQWISNGNAAYLVEEIIIETRAQVASLFNLSDKQIEKAIINIKDATDERFTSTRGGANEEPLEELGAIVYQGATYIALRSSKGAIWIEADQLKPVRKDYRQYGARWEDGEYPYIAVYDDMTEAKALIMPYQTAFAEEMREVAARMLYPVADLKTDATDAQTPEQTKEEGEASG